MSTTLAPTAIPEETIDLLTLRAAFQRPASSALSIIDGRLIIWKEDICDLLVSEGLSEREAERVQKAASRKDLQFLEQSRLAYGFSKERLDQIVDAAAFAISRKGVEGAVRESLSTRSE